MGRSSIDSHVSLVSCSIFTPLQHKNPHDKESPSGASSMYIRKVRKRRLFVSEAVDVGVGDDCSEHTTMGNSGGTILLVV